MRSRKFVDQASGRRYRLRLKQIRGSSHTFNYSSTAPGWFHPLTSAKVTACSTPYTIDRWDDATGQNPVERSPLSATTWSRWRSTRRR